MTLLRLLIALSLIVFMRAEVFAVPLPISGLANATFDFIDSISDFSLVLSGDSVPIESTILNIGSNWEIMLDIILDEGEGRDFISITGEASHIAEPNPPQGVGGVINFSIQFSPILDPTQGTSTSMIVFTPSAEVIVLHGGDSDLYTFAVPLVDTFPGTEQISAWSVVIEGTHLGSGPGPGPGPEPNVIPEPSTFALLGTGMIGLLGYSRRRRDKHV